MCSSYVFFLVVCQIQICFTVRTEQRNSWFRTSHPGCRSCVPWLQWELLGSNDCGYEDGWNNGWTNRLHDDMIIEACGPFVQNLIFVFQFRLEGPRKPPRSTQLQARTTLETQCMVRTAGRGTTCLHGSWSFQSKQMILVPCCCRLINTQLNCSSFWFWRPPVIGLMERFHLRRPRCDIEIWGCTNTNVWNKQQQIIGNVLAGTWDCNQRPDCRGMETHEFQIVVPSPGPFWQGIVIVAIVSKKALLENAVVDLNLEKSVLLSLLMPFWVWKPPSRLIFDDLRSSPWHWWHVSNGQVG